MSPLSRLTAIGASLCLVIGLMLGPLQASAADLKSPDDIKTCLRILMQVTNDFDRQISHQNYQRVPHENMEFGEGVEALRDTLAKEDAGLRAEVLPAVQKAADAAQHVSDLSASKDDAKLKAAQAELVSAVNAVFAYFPQDLRPDPNAGPGRHHDDDDD